MYLGVVFLVLHFNKDYNMTEYNGPERRVNGGRRNSDNNSGSASKWIIPIILGAAIAVAGFFLQDVYSAINKEIPQTYVRKSDFDKFDANLCTKIDRLDDRIVKRLERIESKIDAHITTDR